MNYYSFRYSGRVWLCSVIIAPAIYLFGGYLHKGGDPGSFGACAELYVFITFFEALYSLITLLVFWFIVELTIWLINRNSLRKLLLSFIGIVLTVLTFRIFQLLPSFTFSDSLYPLMLINCGCIGIACWCFRPEPKIDPLTRINPYLYETETQR